MADESTATTMAAGIESSPETTSAPVETTSPSESQAAEPVSIQQPTTTPDAPTETPPLSARDRLKATLADPEIERAYREHVNAEAQRIAAKSLKRERLARAREDPVAALELAQSEYQEVEAEETRTRAASESHAKANADLADLWKDKTWAESYESLRTGPKAAEFNKRYATDPAGFVDWADDQITESRIESRANEKAREMAKAIALEMTNAQLLSTPQHPMGAGSGNQSDAALLARVPDMSAAEYLQNKDRIYAAMRRK